MSDARTFTDTAGETWPVHIDIAALRRVRDLVGINITDYRPGDMDCGLIRVLTDPVNLADVLWAIVKKLAKDRGISAREFGERLAGDPLDAAALALTGAVADFSPSLARRLIEAGLTFHEKSRADAEIIIAKIEREVAGLTPGTSGNESPGSAESSDTIPADTRSGN